MLDASGGWYVVGERSSGPASDTEVWRDFGDEAWARRDAPAPTTRPMLVSRRLRAAVDDISQADIEADDERRFAVRTPTAGVELLQGSRALQLAAVLGGSDGFPWLLARTNHLGLSESLVLWMLRGEPALPGLGSAPAIRESLADDAGLRFEWEPDSWLEAPPGSSVVHSDVARLLAPDLTGLLNRLASEGA